MSGRVMAPRPEEILDHIYDAMYAAEADGKLDYTFAAACLYNMTNTVFELGGIGVLQWLCSRLRKEEADRLYEDYSALYVVHLVMKNE